MKNSIFDKIIRNGRQISFILPCSLLVLTTQTSCSDENEPLQEESGTLSIRTSIQPFDGEKTTRVNLDGTKFEDGDLIRLKIICPFTSAVLQGEETNSATQGAYWLLESDGTEKGWTPVPSSRGFDLNGDFMVSDAPDPSTWYHSQATPYVFTASTWTEEISFVEQDVDPASITPIILFSNVFHADQSLQKNYKASDVLWAQQYMETGCWDVHLSFKHVMSALEITIVDSENKIGSDAVLTLEGMPAIDQQEIIVGDYYAAKAKDATNTNPKYDYKARYSCTYEQNGTVIGVGTNSTSGSVVSSLASIPNTATYTALKDTRSTKTFRLIVPPMATVPAGATFWIRSGATRYSMLLSSATGAPTTFEAGKLYPIKITVN